MTPLTDAVHEDRLLYAAQSGGSLRYESCATFFDGSGRDQRAAIVEEGIPQSPTRSATDNKGILGPPSPVTVSSGNETDDTRRTQPASEDELSDTCEDELSDACICERLEGMDLNLVRCGCGGSGGHYCHLQLQLPVSTTNAAA